MSPTGHRGQEAVVTSAVFCGLATVTVLLRLYTRFFIVRCAGIEDYFVSLAMLCSIGLTICIGIQVEYGMGQHIDTLTPDVMRNSLKAFWASLIVYYLSLGLTKSSILLQYRRVFPTKAFQIACWSIMGVVIVYTIWTVFGSIFACVPVRAFWTKEKDARCIDQFAMWFTNAGINILTDLAIIILPMPVIRNLNLARRQKQALIGIFAIGGFVCVVSILRLQSLVAISNSSDPTYDNPPAATWSSVETNVGIICSCLPCLRPLATKWLPGVFSSFKSGVTKSQPYGRSAYGHHSVGPATLLESINIKNSHGSSRSGPDHEDGIQVITTVDVRVEDSKDQVDSPHDKEFGMHKPRHSDSSSTDSLVRDIAMAV